MKPMIESPGMGLQQFPQSREQVTCSQNVDRRPDTLADGVLRRGDFPDVFNFQGLVVGIETEPVYDLSGRHRAVSDSGEKSGHVRKREAVGYAFERFLIDPGQTAMAKTPQLVIENQPAVVLVFSAFLTLEPLPDLVAGVTGPNYREPVAAGSAATFAGKYLYPVTVLKLVFERHQPPVDLGTYAVVTDFGVDAVGEVERSRAGGEDRPRRPWARRRTPDR